MDREDTLEKGMATHLGIFAWKIPQIKEPGGLQSMGSQRVRHDLVHTRAHTHTHTHTHCYLTAQTDGSGHHLVKAAPES